MPSVSNAAAAASSPSTYGDSVDAASSTRLHAPSRLQDDHHSADDLEGDADADEDDDDVEQIGGSEAHHNMINELTVKSGYLEKKGEKRKTWKKRWFVLRSSKLAYYKNDKEYQLLRFIDVGDIKTVASVELKKSVNTFGIVTPKRTFYVRASSRADMESWIERLNEVMTQYAQSSTMTQEMAALELANTETPAPSATLPPQQRRSASQERAHPASSAQPIKIGIPSRASYVAPAQPRPIPGSAAFSPLTTTSDSDTGAERYGLSYASSTGPSMSGSPSTRPDPSHLFLAAGQSPSGGGGHTSGSEMSDAGGGHQRRPSAGFGSLPRQRSTSATRRLASFSSGPADQPSSPIFPPGGGGQQVLSSSDEEDEWDEEEVADQAMPLPALGSSQNNAQTSSLATQAAHAQHLASPGQASGLSISPLPTTANDLIRDPNKVITQGYLMKQSGRRKVWRKRWFVLTPARLLYSRSHMDAKAHRQIAISSMLDAIEYEPKKASALPTSPALGGTANPFAPEHAAAASERDGSSAFSPGAASSAGAPPEKPERRGSMVAVAAGVASNMSAGMVGGSRKRKENCFQIITPKRTFILCAPGEDEEIKWISALKTLINRQRNGPTPNGNPPLSPTTGAPASSFPFYATSPSSASAAGTPAQDKPGVPAKQTVPTDAPGGHAQLSSIGAAAQTLSSSSLASNTAGAQNASQDPAANRQHAAQQPPANLPTTAAT